MKKQILAILVLSVLSVVTALSVRSAVAAIHTVQVQNNSFIPSTLNVYSGDTVRFQWVSGSHTTTCDPAALTGTSYPASPTFHFNGWNSVINSSNTDLYVPIINPGTYTYGCIPHWPAMQGTIIASVGYKLWAGTMFGGDNFTWSDPLNWIDGVIPSATDSVLLDNSYAATTYLANLPGGNVNTVVAKIIIKPTPPFIIYLTLPASNTNNPGLTVGNPNSVYDFVINKTGVFRNQSGASLGTGVTFASLADSIQLLDSGLWVHGTNRDAAGITNRLSRLPNTKYGIWRYDVPTTSPFSISASGQNYGSLELSGFTAGGGLMGKKYFMSGSNEMTIRGNFFIDEYCYDSTAMTANLNIGGNFKRYGKFVWANSATPQVINLNGSTLQNLSCDGLSAAVFALSGKIQFNNPAGFHITTPFYADSVFMLNGNISSQSGGWLGIGYDSLNKGFLSRTGGIVTGQLERWFLAGVVSDSLLYPVGTSTVLKKAYVKFSTPPTTAGRIGLKFIDNGNGGTTLPSTLNDGGYSVNRRSNSYWEMTGTWLTGGQIDVSFDANGQSGITNPANLRVIWSNNSGASFSLQGNHQNGYLNTARRTGIPFYFSNFYLGGNNSENLLPVKLISSEIPAKFDINQNYPNPFNPETKINYDLPVHSKVSIKVYDVSGKEVAELVNSVQNAGFYNVTFNASSLSSGVYFYTINAKGLTSEFSKTMKMILIK